MAENPQPLTKKTITAIQNNAKTIDNIATEISRATGVSITPLGIASPVAREMNKNEIDYPRIFVPLRNAIVSGTNDSLMQNYYDVLKNDPTNRTSTIRGIYNRLTNPALNDIGPGKFRIATAASLLQAYMNDRRFAKDPFDLFKYDGHLDQLVRDLNSNTSATAIHLTYKLSGLMNLEAVDWYTSNMGQARWNKYSPEEQARLITTYYTLGKERMTDGAAAQIAKSRIYTPDLNSDGGIYVGSGSNMGVMKGALGQGAIVTRPDGTTQYLDGNGKIIREDSPAVTLDPTEAAGSGFQSRSTIREFDPNNNVIRKTQKFSNADGSQRDSTQFADSVWARPGDAMSPANPQPPNGSPALPAPGTQSRSAAPDGTTPSSAQGALPATPASQPYTAGTGGILGKFWDSLIAPAEAASPPPQGALLLTPFFPGQEPLFGDRSGIAPGVPSPDTPLRRISSAFPGMALPDPDPAPPPQAERPLGIFTGKPMPSWTTPPPLGGLLNNSNPSGNNDGFNLLAGLTSRNPTPPEPPPQTAGSIPERRLGSRTYSVSSAPAYDPRALAAPLVPSDDANYAGGPLGMFAGKAGTNSQNPNQPPLDDEQEQADLQALEDRLASTGNINDAWELFKARIASRRY